MMKVAHTTMKSKRESHTDDIYEHIVWKIATLHLLILEVAQKST